MNQINLIKKVPKYTNHKIKK